MNTTSNWFISDEEKRKQVMTLSANLSPLRATVGVSQEELANVIGVSRQTYSGIETGKKHMTWSLFLSLLLFFDYNQATHKMIRELSIFPYELVERFNIGNQDIKYSVLLEDKNEAVEIAKMVQALDDKGRHAVRTILLMEYLRCTGSLEKLM